MIISQLESIGSSKVKVYIDGEYAFLLYQKDIRKYQIEEGKVITSITYNEIIEDTILHRAKQKALAVLKFMDRTEYELRNKLKSVGYTEDIIDRVLNYVIDYGYINDERYASMYIRTKKHTKSKMVLRLELLRKGINNEIVDTELTSEYDIDEAEDPEIIAIKKAISKKYLNTADLSREDKQKLIASLYRKGFEIDKIKKVLSLPDII